MEDFDNLHAGHRKRMADKLLAGPSLEEHELLEMILYDCLPRVNTNPIAHKLLRMFGSLKNVLSASPEQLMSISGVGKKTATKIVLLNQVIEKIGNVNVEKKNMFSYSNNKQDLIEFFAKMKEEKFMIFLLDSKFFLIKALAYEDRNRDNVSADIPEIAKAISSCNCRYAIISHNHPSGNVMPSYEDDFATLKINLLCSVLGVTLTDHIIVGTDDAYSYHNERRLDYIKDSFSLENCLKRN